MSKGITRRSFLFLSGATAGLVLYGKSHLRQVGGLALAERIARLFGANPGSAEIGALYLKENPAEANAEQLAASIVESDHLFWFVRSDAALLEEIRNSVRTDFASGRTVKVSNWILSETEARVLAVVSLVAKS